jgi:poly(A) polymerase
MAVESLAPPLLLHLLATARSASADLWKNPKSLSDFVRYMLHAYHNTYLPRKARPPLVTGRDLQVVFGLSPSPLFKQVLTRIEEDRLSGEISDRTSALKIAEKMIRKT